MRNDKLDASRLTAPEWTDSPPVVKAWIDGMEAWRNYQILIHEDLQPDHCTTFIDAWMLSRGYKRNPVQGGDTYVKNR